MTCLFMCYDRPDLAEAEAVAVAEDPVSVQA